MGCSGVARTLQCFTKRGYDPQITITGEDGGSLTLSDFFRGEQHGVDKLVFADGTVWSRSDLSQRWLAWRGNPVGGLVEGTPSDEVFIGSDGDDALYGGLGNDVLDGGRGNDLLQGGIFTVDDSWQGLTGNDTYSFGANFGQDVVADYSWDNTVDRIEFTEYNLSDFVIVRSGESLEDLILSRVGSTDKVTIKSFSYLSGRIEAF